MQIIEYAMLPACAMVVGLYLYVLRPGMRWSSIINFEYLSTGMVIGAVSAELLPQILVRHNPFAVVLGFGAGTTLCYMSTAGLDRTRSVGLPLLLMQVGLNASMMGLLIGSGFVAGSQQGRLLSLALIGRASFIGLNLSPTASLNRSSRGAGAAIVAGAATVAAVSGLSFVLVNTLPHLIFDSVLAFGLSGVLYLATRDLVLEIGDQDQAGFRTALFCTGYVLWLVLHMATTSRTEPELIP